MEGEGRGERERQREQFAITCDITSKVKITVVWVKLAVMSENQPSPDTNCTRVMACAMIICIRIMIMYIMTTIIYIDTGGRLTNRKNTFNFQSSYDLKSRQRSQKWHESEKLNGVKGRT